MRWSSWNLRKPARACLWVCASEGAGVSSEASGIRSQEGEQRSEGAKGKLEVTLRSTHPRGIGLLRAGTCAWKVNPISRTKTFRTAWFGNGWGIFIPGCADGRTCAWQPLIGGRENGASGVKRGFDQPPPASSTCNSSFPVSSPPAGPFQGRERLRANKNLESIAAEAALTLRPTTLHQIWATRGTRAPGGAARSALRSPLPPQQLLRGRLSLGGVGLHTPRAPRLALT